MSDKYINPSGLQTIKTWVESKIPVATSDLINDENFISADDLEPASSMTFVSYQEGEVATWENDAAIIPVGGGGGGDIPTRLSQLINDVGYITISSVPTKTSELTNDSNFPVDASYVHTDNNFTTTLKNKLDGIAAGAEVNVNADWNASSGDARILNKPTALSDFTNDEGFIDNTVSNLVNYYTTTNTYTKTEVNNLIGQITGVSILVVDTLPQVGQSNIIYLVPQPVGQNTDSYYEYLWLEEEYELIGSTDVDLSNYLQTTGNASNTTVSFTTASSRTLPATGDNLSTLIGKITKYLNDLHTVAFSGSYNDLSNKPTIPNGSSTSPKMDGTATVGTETTWAHGDHIHPSDTNKQDKITANGILKGNGSGTITAAVAGTDYQTPLTAGTDYQTPLPTQTGNNGKFLTTDGSNLSWGTPSGGGSGDSNIFVATYGTTTTADIEAAYQAGKLIYCIYSSRLYTYGYRSSATAHYFYAWQGNTKYSVYTSSTATWSNTSASMAPTASPSLTGSPTATTATAGTNSTRIATTAFVTTAISNAITAALAGGY